MIAVGNNWSRWERKSRNRKETCGGNCPLLGSRGHFVNMELFWWKFVNWNMLNFLKTLHQLFRQPFRSFTCKSINDVKSRHYKHIFVYISLEMRMCPENVLFMPILCVPVTLRHLSDKNIRYGHLCKWTTLIKEWRYEYSNLILASTCSMTTCWHELPLNHLCYVHPVINCGTYQYCWK